MYFNPIQTGLSGIPWTGGVASNAAIRFLKTIEGIELVKLTPQIKRRELNLLLLSYLSCGVT